MLSIQERLPHSVKHFDQNSLLIIVLLVVGMQTRILLRRVEASFVCCHERCARAAGSSFRVSAHWTISDRQISCMFLLFFLHTNVMKNDISRNIKTYAFYLFLACRCLAYTYSVFERRQISVYPISLVFIQSLPRCEICVFY